MNNRANKQRALNLKITGALVLFAIVGTAIGISTADKFAGPKRTAAQMQAAEIAHTATLAERRAATLRQDLAGACADGTIKTTSAGLIAACVGQKWVAPLTNDRAREDSSGIYAN